MNVEIVPFSALPCRLQKFTINGKDAFTDDFGTSEMGGDVNEYNCYHNFISDDEPSIDVLKKYEISEEEYHQICEKLKEKLRVTDCGWCS